MATTTSATLLIVDDEAAHMKALCDTLRNRGYATVGFTSAQDALAALREQDFDLMLTDLMMPGMDGVALLGAAQEIRPFLVGILMTGHGSIDTAVEAMKVGALDYILKPFKLSAVLPVLSRALAVRALRLENATLDRKVRERTAALEIANSDLEAFSYSISHDLRAPLRAVNAFSHMLQSGFAPQMPAEAQALLNRVVTSASRMEQLIEDLLRFSRLAGQPLSKRPVNVMRLAQETVDELRQLQPQRRVEIRLNDLPDGVADPSLLKQVLVNLLSNAFKFTQHRETGIIEIGWRQDTGEHVYYVRDNGAGFDMQYAAKLFTVFQRLHRTDEFEGSGIGLSIVQRIIQRHGGRVWAEASVNQGATFYFTLSTRDSG